MLPKPEWESRAIELGAVCVREEWINNAARFPYDRPHRFLFAVRYFNKDMQEVAYWLACMDQFAELREFQPPRVWDQTFLDMLTPPKPLNKETTNV